MEKQLVAVGVLKECDVAVAKCECCGLTEECTEEYIKRVRDRFSGRWVCGLCAEAVKEEESRSVSAERRIGKEEALHHHISFCMSFSPPPKTPTSHDHDKEEDQLISAVKHLLFKTLDSSSSPRKRPCSNIKQPAAAAAVHHSSSVPLLSRYHHL